MSWVSPADVAAVLAAHHYLGATKRGLAWLDDAGVMVFASPTSRRLPTHWLDLTRWCILDRSKNAGSRQWGNAVRAIRKQFPATSTIVSYSDPAVGHNGALYRACNWWWAPTWHRLRPPPTGQGSWTDGKQESVKDRWVFALQPDADREALLVARDESVLRRLPCARYREPGGADYRKWKELVAP